MRNIGFILCVLWAGHAFGQTTLKATSQQPTERAFDIELGGAAGFPVLGAFVAGIWGKRVPLMARLSLGFGSQADLGVVLNPSNDLNVYLAASGGGVLFTGSFEGVYGFVGPTAGLKFRGFWIQGGPDYCFGSMSNSFLLSSWGGFFFHAQAGFSVFL